MSKDTIHFAHANSFPARTYSKLFSYLEDDFKIAYLERHAHNPNYPVTDGWHPLALELRHEIERQHSKPVIGIGHSLGGILHFLVAVENPELYESIILLDAPLVGPLRGAALKMAKKIRRLERLTPSHQARLRKNKWQSREEALQHFATKEKFKKFDEQVLQDYVRYGTVENEQGIELLFKREIEASIYRSLPDSYKFLHGKLKVPAAYIGGSHSLEGKLAGLGYMKRNFPFSFYTIKGSHLFPLEQPQTTANLIKSVILTLSK